MDDTEKRLRELQDLEQEIQMRRRRIVEEAALLARLVEIAERVAGEFPLPSTGTSLDVSQ